MLYNARKHFIEINTQLGKENELVTICDSMRDFCDLCGIDFALIVHDKDTDKNGVPKRVHLHAYLDGKTRFTSEFIISNLRDILVDKGMTFNNEQFSDRKVINEVSCLQYLIHKNDGNKYQYDISEVVTNNEKYLQIIENGIVSYDENKLIYMVQTLNYHELLVEVGIDYARANHNVIMQLYKMKRETTL